MEYGAGSALAPTACRWCGASAVEDRVRTALRWDDVERAATISDVTGRGLAPALALVAVAGAARTGDAARWFDVGAPVVEAWLATSITTQIIKLAAARRRPYALHAAPAVEPRSEDNQSFVSGHTSTATALVTAAGAVLWRTGQHPAAVATWVVGGAVALTTGYLRIAADAHHAGDVLAGAALGAGLGLLVPALAGAEAGGTQVVLRPDGVALAGAW